MIAISSTTSERLCIVQRIHCRCLFQAFSFYICTLFAPTGALYVLRYATHTTCSIHTFLLASYYSEMYPSHLRFLHFHYKSCSKSLQEYICSFHASQATQRSFGPVLQQRNKQCKVQRKMWSCPVIIYEGNNDPLTKYEKRNKQTNLFLLQSLEGTDNLHIDSATLHLLQRILFDCLGTVLCWLVG